ncbi:MAG: ThiF family adenylyltransferase [Desulforhabdus sp.]|jgi:molybdopterin/thiamine biosynthesis adenylyltransferase|nr:ThiF family adenylyltransferase [Desulforhabdus sp.]
MWNALVDRQTGFLNFTSALAAALRKTVVAAVGAGGNGVVVDQLARIGFERFILIDPDVVEQTNLNRLPFTISEIGVAKVVAWKSYLQAVNPGCRVAAYPRSVTRHDASWLKRLLAGADLIFPGTTDLEANLVVSRICSQLGRRMIVGPSSSGAYVVSTFTHDNELTLEKVAGFGTEHLELSDIDYPALKSKYVSLSFYPGRTRKLYPEVRESMLVGRLPARSCKIFVSLTNAAMAFEAVKNVAVMRGLSLDGTRVVAMPIVHIFDPYSGCAYYYNILDRTIGIPDWLTGETRWQPYDGD